MNIHQLKKLLMKRLARDEWELLFDERENKLSVIHRKLKKGAHLSLNPLLAKYERMKESAIDEAVRYIEVTLKAMEQEEITLKGNEKRIFPVIRSSSFPTESKDKRFFVYFDHTAETRIFFALDLGDYYQLIDEELMGQAGFTKETLKETALFNLRSLPYQIKQDQVAGNTFYFINTNDGYDASRLLDTSIVEKVRRQIKGEFACAIPHQDVCIFADLVNETGYDVLGQMVFQFFAQGKIPITALSFFFNDGELEPMFILAQRRPKQ